MEKKKLNNSCTNLSKKEQDRLQDLCKRDDIIITKVIKKADKAVVPNFALFLYFVPNLLPSNFNTNKARFE